MMEIRGKINSAICYASVIEDEAALQIRRMCDYPFSVGSKIRLEKNMLTLRIIIRKMYL